MAHALGTTDATAHSPGLNVLSKELKGQTGLIFSQRPPQELLVSLDELSRDAYARAGTPASRGFTLPAGVLHTRGGEIPSGDDVRVTVAQEVQLRSLGLPTRVVKGNVMLENDYVVCKEGEVLDARQSNLLKLFGVEAAEFRMLVTA